MHVDYIINVLKSMLNITEHLLIIMHTQQKVVEGLKPNSDFINLAASHRNQKLQFSIISKVMNQQNMRIPSSLIYNISVYIFTHPFRLTRALYCSTHSLMNQGSYLISNGQGKKIRVSIERIWESVGNHQLQKSHIMRLSNHFYDFLDSSKSQIIEGESSNLQDIYLASNKSLYFRALLADIIRYRKNRQINEKIISAFCVIMNCNIGLLRVRETEKCLIISQSSKKDCLMSLPEYNLQFKFITTEKEERKTSLKLTTPNCSIYRLENEIKSRNELEIIDSKTFLKYYIDDIFIT